MRLIKTFTSRLLILVIIVTLFQSCDSNNLKPIPLDNFVGTWELNGRSMFNGLKIKIEENQNNELIGKVVALNDNKYVNMFIEINDTWITRIKRSSNFEFKITEKKIGSALFSVYDLSTSTEYKAEFIDENTIGLSSDGDPSTSSITYRRTN